MTDFWREVSVLALSATVGISAPALSAGPGRVVLLPPENLTTAVEAPQRLAAGLARALDERGWEIADAATVEAALRDARARSLDSLPGELVPRLLDTVGASALVYSTVQSWLDGPNAIIALSARLEGADGTEIWSALASLSASQTESALGFHRAQGAAEVAERVVERLTRSLPAPEDGAAVRWERRHRPRFDDPPRSVRSAAWSAGEPRRVFLVPLRNATAERSAPRQLGELLARRLATSGAFDVVAPAELRAALLAEKVPALDALDPPRLRAVGEHLGSGVYLRGAIWKWKEASAQGAAVFPEVELELELVDAAADQVLWAAHHSRSGRDYEGLFLRGAIGGAVALADQVIAEMLDAALRDGASKGTPAAPKGLVR